MGSRPVPEPADEEAVLDDERISAVQRAKEGIENADTARDAFLRSFCKEYGKKTLWLWGEYAVPQILAHVFYLRTIDATPASDFLIHTLMQSIARKNRPGSDQALANPYYDA